MVIIGQAKDLVVNFDRINFIKIEPDENEFDIEINYSDDNWDVIGTYKSFEKAQNVLQEIVEKYHKWNKDSNNAVTILPKVYYMPKD